jgi:hypothetical protein
VEGGVVDAGVGDGARAHSSLRGNVRIPVAYVITSP